MYNYRTHLNSYGIRVSGVRATGLVGPRLGEGIPGQALRSKERRPGRGQRVRTGVEKRQENETGIFGGSWAVQPGEEKAKGRWEGRFKCLKILFKGV